MNDRTVREAVSLYVHGDLTETEAARIADISRAQFRHYVRTCGPVASTSFSTDDADPST